MEVISQKAPSKTKIAKAALFAAFAIVAASNGLVLEAQAKEEVMQMEEETTSEAKADTTTRYIYTTFGELIDTKYCETEEHVKYITEKVCNEGNYKYVTPELLESIAYQESKFVADAENGSAITMYQIKPHFHEEEMQAAGVTLEEIESCTEAQTRLAAEVVEKYAEIWDEKDIPEEDILHAVVANYHLTQESANEMIQSREWDNYTKAVIDRSEVIALNKSLEQIRYVKPSLYGENYEIAI